MWTPAPFRLEDTAALHDLIRAHPFGIVVSADDHAPLATHLPLMVDPARGPNGALLGHMARANPHWSAWTADKEVLVIFRGGGAYVSPNWYEDRVTVPTWNYVAVHVYGTPILIHDVEILRDLTTALTHRHERSVRGDWELAEAEPIMDAELRGIVGFEIPIARIVGKAKLNQNRSRADQAGVARALFASDSASDRSLGRHMRRALGEDESSADLDPGR